MKEYIFLENKYKLIKDFNNGFDEKVIKDKITDYYAQYDYIVGDWAYGKIRLKGFAKKGNKLFNQINDYKKVEKYISDSCAYGCKHFILEKI